VPTPTPVAVDFSPTRVSRYPLDLCDFVRLDGSAKRLAVMDQVIRYLLVA
jgi:hypothetical protein